MPAPVARDVSEEAKRLRCNFVWFAVAFAVNHGVVTTPVVLATSIFEKDTAYTGLALLNIFTVISAMLLGAPLVSALGLKGGVLFGMLFYCVYAGLFSLATFGSGELWSSSAQWILFCIGSSCGGIAAGVLWTAQGGYFSRTVDLILESRRHGEALEPKQRAELSAELAGTFAFWYLGVEVVAKLLWSVLDRLHFEKWIIAALYAGVGSVAMLFMAARAMRLEPSADSKASAEAAGPASKLVAAIALWRDPCTFLLAGSNLTFGFCAAFMNGYVNGTYAVELGSFAPTMLAAVTVLTAAVLSKLFGPLAARCGKGPFVLLGACCFGIIPVCLLVPGGCCATWGWWLVLLYVLQGTGRAVYESTNKGVFADFFPEPHAVGAFANVMLQSSAAFAMSFFLSKDFTEEKLATVVLVLAVLTPCGYVRAAQLRTRRLALAARPLLGQGQANR